MLWITLFNKLGKQPIKETNKTHVYALIYNEKTHKYDKKYLELKYDAFQFPYFVEKKEKNHGRK